MQTLLIAVGAFVAYLAAYHTYGRWLSRKVFQLSPDAACPSVEINDGTDYVPTKREVIFGHHFTSIAGTGPIVGPAIAVFWGWLPALIWVLVGSIFIGAVHDFGSLVVSLRNRGQTVGDVAARMLNPRARILLLLVLFLVLMVVIGIFGLVIAVIFTLYPISVFAIWIEVPIAIAVGYLVYKKGGNVAVLSIIAVILMYVGVWIGAYYLPIDLSQFDWLAKNGTLAEQAGLSSWANVVVIWTAILLIYGFIASVLPVWTLLQPRDFINSHQLFVALALLFVGLVATSVFGGGLEFVTKPIAEAPPDAPPMMPFLFITIACGAVSGFHCLVSSGTSSKQLRRETDAQMVGYGAMLFEGVLAIVVILACTAGIGKGIWEFDADTSSYVARLGAEGQPLVGAAAWKEFYGQNSWSAMTLGQKLGAFIEGGANLMCSVGLPITLCIGIMTVLIASFAATTLDTAVRFAALRHRRAGRRRPCTRAQQSLRGHHRGRHHRRRVGDDLRADRAGLRRTDPLAHFRGRQSATRRDGVPRDRVLPAASRAAGLVPASANGAHARDPRLGDVPEHRQVVPIGLVRAVRAGRWRRDHPDLDYHRGVVALATGAGCAPRSAAAVAAARRIGNRRRRSTQRRRWPPLMRAEFVEHREISREAL